LTRLQRLLYVAVAPLLKDIRITERTGLLLSTTKGDIRSLEKGTDALPFLHHTAKELAEVLGIRTTPMVVSNACVSGVMALSVASRLLEAGVYDSMLIVAGDEVTDFVLSGFNSFQAMSSSPCKPYDANRDGISLGEATAALWLSNEREGAVAKIVGGASINDANHISGPSRTGEGLYLSIAAALQQAGLQPEAIDLINAHGTATLFNDQMEAIAIHRAELQDIPVNALKGYTRLNVKGLQRIKHGGILFTFSCSQVVSKEHFRNAVFTAAAQAGRKVRILHQLHQPADHPINIYHPEGEYLKGLVLYVE